MMENRGRRGRRSRNQHQSAPSSFGAKSLLVTAGVICLTYSMLQYSSRNCVAKQELMKLTSSVEDIAKQLNVIQNNYQLLEDKMVVYSRELPKLEKQMAVFETFSQTMEANRFGWNPRIRTALPYVDVKLIDLTKPAQEVPNKNTTETSSIRNLTKNSKCEIKFENKAIKYKA